MDSLIDFLRDPPLGPAEWALLIVGLILLVRQAFSIALRRRPGPVAIDPLKGFASESERDEVRAIITDHLGQVKLFPADLTPGGPLSADLPGVIEESPLPQAKWAAAVVRLLARLRATPSGHTVAVTRGSGPEAAAGIAPVRLTLEIADRGTGRGEAVRTVEAGDVRRAAARAAYEICVDVYGHPPVAGGIAPFLRWTEPEALHAYQEGSGLAPGASGKEEAKLLLARELQFANVLPRIDLADHWEGATGVGAPAALLEALRGNLEVLARWPRLREACYRLAVIWSQVQPEQLSGNAPAGSSLLAIRRLCEPGLPEDPGEEHLRARSTDAWSQLERGLRARALIRSWLASATPWNWHPGERRYHGALLLRGLPRRRLRHWQNIAATARLCTEVRNASGAALPALDKKLRKALRVLTPKRPIPCRPDAQSRYNEACFHSLALGAGGDGRVERAIEALEAAIRDPRSTIEPRWVRKDRDLEPLRATEAFKAWAASALPPPDD